MRRLPVYLLLDTSGSMYGAPIEAVQLGISQLVNSLHQDPYALETVHLSVITFAETAQQIVPLTELSAFEIPKLNASGMTSLGAALSLLAEKIDEELVKTTYEEKGDWKPLVFLMSDGVATDNLDAGIEACARHKFGIFVACAAGQLAAPDELKKVSPVVVHLDTLDDDGIKSFFKWVSASVSATSVKIENCEDEQVDLLELPPPPKEISIV